MSDSFLSQEEVDALLEGVTGESQRSEVVEVDLGQVRSYDISSQERIVRGRMPTMEIVNERFARNFRIGLFNFIRRSPEVSVGTVTVQRYSAFLRELAVPTNFNIMAIRPLRGNGLIVCEPSLVFGVIDTLYGGTGRLQTRIEGRDFSTTEQRVINRLVNVVCEEYKKPGMASIRWSWPISARKCSLSSPISPRPAKSWFRPHSSWRSAISRVPSISACLMRRWSRFAMCCIRPPRAMPSRWTAAGSRC